jgi:hypothetical protein
MAIFRQPSRSGAPALAYIQLMRDRSAMHGFTAMGVFLFFGAVMAGLAATTLLWRGTALDRVWNLNPTAYKRLVPLGGAFGILFLLLGTALTTAGIGWFRRRLWGWRLAVVIIATQVLGVRQRGLAARRNWRHHRRVHYCCFFCNPKSEPRLPRISLEEIQKADSQPLALGGCQSK